MAIFILVSSALVLIFSFPLIGDFLKKKRVPGSYLIALISSIALTVFYFQFVAGFVRSEIHGDAGNGNLNAIKKYIEKGGDVNKRHKNNGRTILSYAVTSGNKELVEYLITEGANVNAGEDEWDTPLHYAARENDLEIVKLLLSSGANPNVFAENYENPYVGTAHMDYPHKGTALHWSLCSDKGINRKKRTIEALLRAGANPNAQSSSVDAPLEYAVKIKNTPIFKMLIEKGADANVGVALHKAVLLNNYEMVKLLVENGADVNKSAVISSRFEPLDELAGHPVSLGGKKVTPLDIAKSSGIRQILIEAGAKE
jgi:ankyrin repeat protein